MFSYFWKVYYILVAAKKLPGLVKEVAKLEADLDFLKSRREVDRSVFWDLQEDRETPEFQAAFDEPEPLVTVIVATYNRAMLVSERCVSSILNQTYRNIEVIVVGDHCTDDTEARLKLIDDPRLRFINLPMRGHYPSEPRRRWMVAGTPPLNHALALAKGQFVAHLDDDDEYLPTRIETLVKFAQTERAELVVSPFHLEKGDSWSTIHPKEFKLGQITTSAMFYHRWFARIGWDIDAHLLDEPGDWNRARKFKYLGVKVAYHTEPLLKHYAERRQAKP